MRIAISDALQKKRRNYTRHSVRSYIPRVTGESVRERERGVRDRNCKYAWACTRLRDFIHPIVTLDRLDLEARERCTQTMNDERDGGGGRV